MGRLITIAVAVVSCLLIWKSGAVDSLMPGSIGRTSPTADPGANIALSGDAMQKLKSVHLSMNGTLVLHGMAGVKLTGSGDLVYPHKENLSMQLSVPSTNGQYATMSVNERIENGHDYVQIPSQSTAWKDVTGDSKSQIAPGMDPIANLEFVHSFRASDDLGDITMDNIGVHHFSLTVDPGKYVADLKADPANGITGADEAELTGAGIQVEVWISASDHYLHQMKINLDAPDFSWDMTYHYSNYVTGSATNSA
jgi:hypothetical protein